MEHIGIDVHKKHTQICIQDEVGNLVVEQRIPTTRERLRAFFGSRAPSKIILEASTISDWVARCLEECGHEAVVVDPNYPLTYATRNPKIKTDMRDARALADACRHGHYRKSHRMSAQAREKRAWLGNRSELVRCRTSLVNRVRAQVSQHGVALRSGGAENVPSRVEEIDMPDPLRAALTPMVEAIKELTKQIHACDEKLAELAKESEVAKRLMTAPSVGPVTALAFEAVIDDASRFKNAGSLENYIGLTPGAHESGKVAASKLGAPITRRGNSMLRSLLVEAGHRILSGRAGAKAAELREWGQKIKARRGTGVAAVALARRLAGVLYAMWRDGTNYEPDQLGKRKESRKAA